MCSRPCRPRSVAHIGTQLRCCEPRGAMSCGSPMPRGEQIARPAEWSTHAAGLFRWRLALPSVTREVAMRPSSQSAIAFSIVATLLLVGGYAARRGSPASRTHTYYIAADEVTWDYAPTGRDQVKDQPFAA